MFKLKLADLRNCIVLNILTFELRINERIQ